MELGIFFIVPCQCSWLERVNFQTQMLLLQWYFSSLFTKPFIRVRNRSTAAGYMFRAVDRGKEDVRQA